MFDRILNTVAYRTPFLWIKFANLKNKYFLLRMPHFINFDSKKIIINRTHTHTLPSLLWIPHYSPFIRLSFKDVFSECIAIAFAFALAFESFVVARQRIFVCGIEGLSGASVLNSIFGCFGDGFLAFCVICGNGRGLFAVCLLYSSHRRMIELVSIRRVLCVCLLFCFLHTGTEALTTVGESTQMTAHASLISNENLKSRRGSDSDQKTHCYHLWLRAKQIPFIRGTRTVFVEHSLQVSIRFQTKANPTVIVIWDLSFCLMSLIAA